MQPFVPCDLPPTRMDTTEGLSLVCPEAGFLTGLITGALQKLILLNIKKCKKLHDDKSSVSPSGPFSPTVSPLLVVLGYALRDLHTHTHINIGFSTVFVQNTAYNTRFHIALFPLHILWICLCVGTETSTFLSQLRGIDGWGEAFKKCRFSDSTRGWLHLNF